jgi:hypothetical protein
VADTEVIAGSVSEGKLVEFLTSGREVVVAAKPGETFHTALAKGSSPVFVTRKYGPELARRNNMPGAWSGVGPVESIRPEATEILRTQRFASQAEAEAVARTIRAERDHGKLEDPTSSRRVSCRWCYAGRTSRPTGRARVFGRTFQHGDALEEREAGTFRT